MKRSGRRLRRYLVLLQSTAGASRWVKSVDALSKEDAARLAGAGPGDMILTEADAKKLALVLTDAANGKLGTWGPLAFRVK